jgi:hypothetical protein
VELRGPCTGPWRGAEVLPGSPMRVSNIQNNIHIHNTPFGSHRPPLVVPNALVCDDIHLPREGRRMVVVGHLSPCSPAPCSGVVVVVTRPRG